ncbi:MAG: hypothetical protein AAF296_11530 [Pseudomonadota bacterium]
MTPVTALLVAVASMYAAHLSNTTLFPRRHGEIRPSIAWLIAGSGTLVFFTLLAGSFFMASEIALLVIAIMFAGGGIVMIGFYFHRRLIFRRRALYDVKAGRVATAVPYICAWQCQLGRDIEREGIIIQGVGARRWAIPGATSREALSEALWCLKDAGVRLPEEHALKQRFGITLNMIDRAAPQRLHP